MRRAESASRRVDTVRVEGTSGPWSLPAAVLLVEDRRVELNGDELEVLARRGASNSSLQPASDGWSSPMVGSLWSCRSRSSLMRTPWCSHPSRLAARDQDERCCPGLRSRRRRTGSTRRLERQRLWAGNNRSSVRRTESSTACLGSRYPRRCRPDSAHRGYRSAYQAERERPNVVDVTCLLLPRWRSTQFGPVTIRPTVSRRRRHFCAGWGPVRVRSRNASALVGDRG